MIGELRKICLSNARAVLRHSRKLAQSVLAGATSLDKALAIVVERHKEDAKPGD